MKNSEWDRTHGAATKGKGAFRTHTPLRVKHDDTRFIHPYDKKSPFSPNFLFADQSCLLQGLQCTVIRKGLTYYQVLPKMKLQTGEIIEIFLLFSLPLSQILSSTKSKERPLSHYAQLLCTYPGLPKGRGKKWAASPK